MKRIPAGTLAVERLESEGWKFHHTATVRKYRYAGTVSPMKSKNGFEFCRVHHGKNVGFYCYQITTVMCRAL